jgi:hypothetical protein
VCVSQMLQSIHESTRSFKDSDNYKLFVFKNLHITVINKYNPKDLSSQLLL